MPSAYQDDLTSDRTYEIFAIGSANGRALKADTLYWANDKTDGQYPSTDVGRVQLSGQAVHRAADTRERAYCILRGGGDRYCFFGTATSVVGTYPIESRYHAPVTRATR